MDNFHPLHKGQYERTLWCLRDQGTTQVTAATWSCTLMCLAGHQV